MSARHPTEEDTAGAVQSLILTDHYKKLHKTYTTHDNSENTNTI
jgi:hypothetical protein